MSGASDATVKIRPASVGTVGSLLPSATSVADGSGLHSVNASCAARAARYRKGSPFDIRSEVSILPLNYSHPPQRGTLLMGRFQVTKSRFHLPAQSGTIFFPSLNIRPHLCRRRLQQLGWSAALDAHAGIIRHLGNDEWKRRSEEIPKAEHHASWGTATSERGAGHRLKSFEVVT